jgi:hypothetical protein
VSPVSPELVLVDPALADSEQIAYRLDDWLTRTEWRVPAPAPPASNVRRAALAAALLVSMLANGLLTSFLLFGQHSGPTLQPAVPAPPTQAASLVNGAAQQVINIPPPNPALLPHTKSK